MEITTLGTGSKGNCYILKSNNGRFCVLDCGLKFKDITSNDHFDSFKNLDFLFVTHEHKDHSLSLKDFERSGVECITYENTIPKQKIEIGQWIIFPFAVIHNALNYGAIIYDKYEQKKIVYVTDFTKMPKIDNVDYWLYEINYDMETANQIIDKKDLEDLHIANNIKYHNSLENAMEYFENCTNKPKLIVACHLSNMGGCDKKILTRMQIFCENIKISRKNETIIF